MPTVMTASLLGFKSIKIKYIHEEKGRKEGRKQKWRAEEEEEREKIEVRKGQLVCPFCTFISSFSSFVCLMSYFIWGGM